MVDVEKEKGRNMENELKNVGACELVSEIFKISKELTIRPTREFDRIDIQRLLFTIENLIVTVQKADISKLSEKEKAIVFEQLSKTV
jgi:hypothetical protein